MADEISIGKQAIKEVQDLRAELVKLSEDALKAGKNLSSISTPSGLNKNGADNAKTGAEIDALKVKYSALNETIVKKAEQSRLAEIRLQQAYEKRFDTFEKVAKKEQAQLEKTNNAYNKTQTQITNLTKVYNDLAVRKARYNDLSEHEEMRLGTLAKVNDKYNGLLRGTDAIIGKNIRNVGNYANGYNALGNSINQLSREAPAFANSINTGFMALSNNFPALFDAINGIRDKNKLLVAEGKPTTSLFKQLVSGIFSWQTLLSVGVTLLTLYGGKIVEWVISLSKVESKLQAVANAQKLINKAQNDAQEGTAKEITHLQLLNKTATDTSLSMNARKTAVKEMQELYPHYLGNLSEEAILTGQTSDEMALLTKNIMAAAVARGIEEEISKKAVKDYKERKLLIGEINSTILENEKLSASNLKGLSGDQLESIRNRDNAAMHLYRKNSEDRLKALIDRQDTENNLLIKGYKKQVELSGKLGVDGKDEADKKIKAKEAKRPEIQQLESFLQQGKPLIIEIDEMLSRLSVERIIASDEGRLEIDSMISKLNDLKTALNGGLPTAEGTILNPVTTGSIEKVNQLSEAMKSYLSSFNSDFISKSGFTETFKILNGEIDGFGKNWQVTTVAIMESAQEMYSFLTQNSGANFDAEKDRLQSQYDIALKYAGDNKAAQEKLSDDLEKNKKDIAYRENKAKQKQAIFNIAVDTAQAIIGLWANPGFPAAIPLSILVGALGIAQIAAVNAQEIPKYWMGGTHDGGLMMVNDGAGSNYKETIVTPDGNIHKPQGRNVVMNAPIGTEIFTHDQWDEQMNNMLKGNGINWSIPAQQQNGISKNDMKEAMLEAIGEQPQYHTNFNGDGVVSYISKRGNITRTNTNRANGRGITF